MANFLSDLESVFVNNGSPDILFNLRRKTMKSATKTILLSFILLSGILLTACPKRVSIADIEANPSRYYDKEVAIAGTVRDSYGVSIPVLNQQGGIYKVDDGSGSIWVITQKSVPTKGTRLGIRGKIQNGVNYNGKNYGLVLMEDDRKFDRGR